LDDLIRHPNGDENSGHISIHASFLGWVKGTISPLGSGGIVHTTDKFNN
jgi:hypothetical protein